MKELSSDIQQTSMVGHMSQTLEYNSMRIQSILPIRKRELFLCVYSRSTVCSTIRNIPCITMPVKSGRALLISYLMYGIAYHHGYSWYIT